MTLTFSDIIENLEARWQGGELLNGPKLVERPLAGDLSISGYRDREASREAGVLVPLVGTDEGLSIFFTKRPETMKEHPGQISFPGGSRAKGDATLVETALREANEEIGLPPDLVRVVGELSPYKTITRYRVTPIIGLIDQSFVPVLDEREVAEAFQAPLGFFLDLSNQRRHTRLHEGRERAYYSFDYQGRYIWGATAAMLINLREALLAFANGEGA